MKKTIKRLINALGYEVKKVNYLGRKAGSDQRPIGRIDYLLEDLRARGLKCMTIFDIGANCSDWSRMAKRIYPEANFLLIEPQLEMKDMLESFCKENIGSEYILAGAGAKQEILTLTIWEGFAGSTFLPKKNPSLIDTGKQREIQVISIDEIITASKAKLPELIKLDIQGFELEALKGAELTFGYTEAYILEVSLFKFGDEPEMPVFSDVISFMHNKGYVVYEFAGFQRRPHDGALAQCDVCFVKENGMFRKSNSWD